MTTFDKIKRYYNKGLYNKAHLAAFVEAGELSEEDLENMLTPSVEEEIKPVVALDVLKEVKLAKISAECGKAITSGVDVETTRGIEHFSLEETDQINLNAALQAVQQGAATYPYHSYGQLCRLFTAEEIMAIVETGTKHKMYHTTLCNHLTVWAKRAETVDEIRSITYSADNLPEDLAANMQAILNPTPAIEESIAE